MGIQLNISDVRLVVDEADFKGYLALMQSLPRAAAEYYAVSVPAAVQMLVCSWSFQALLCVMIGLLMGFDWPSSALMHACTPCLMHHADAAAFMPCFMMMSCRDIQGQRVLALFCCTASE